MTPTFRTHSPHEACEQVFHMFPRVPTSCFWNADHPPCVPATQAPSVAFRWAHLSSEGWGRNQGSLPSQLTNTCAIGHHGQCSPHGVWLPRPWLMLPRPHVCCQEPVGDHCRPVLPEKNLTAGRGGDQEGRDLCPQPRAWEPVGEDLHGFVQSPHPQWLLLLLTAGE